MNKQELIDYFECASDSDDSDVNDDLLTAVKESGKEGRGVVVENLQQNRYLLRSLWLAKTLVMKDAITQIDKYLNSEDVAVKVAAAITSSSLGSSKGKETLDKLLKDKVISPDWVS